MLIIENERWLLLVRIQVAQLSRWSLSGLGGNFFRPPTFVRDPRRRCRYLFHSTRQSLQLPNSRGPMRAQEQFCPANEKSDRTEVDPMGEPGSVGPGGPMRAAHGAGLMCHSLQQAVEGLADGERLL